uniref:Uncharacterized protein n=1 Tax=Nelumbo nucifera TaxID=4432 RepID=A0A822YPQ1_NELNU|nr:TPA_asm: hypothetical protein HUJ06_004713 [Nelumbo nucifera]
MGAFCCCPCSEEFEEYAHPSNSIYRHCICVRYFLLQLFSGVCAVKELIDDIFTTMLLIHHILN